MRFAVYFIVTVLVGYLAIALIGAPMNWPDCGAVFAIATMGCFIIREVRAAKRPENTDEDGK